MLSPSKQRQSKETLSAVLTSSWADGFIIVGCGLFDAALSDRIVQNSCCIEYTGRVAPRCAFSCVFWAHLNGKIPMCIPSNCICRASPLDQRERERCVMFQWNVGQGGWKWMEKKKVCEHVGVGEGEPVERRLKRVKWKRKTRRAAGAGRMRGKLWRKERKREKKIEDGGRKKVCGEIRRLRKGMCWV